MTVTYKGIDAESRSAANNKGIRTYSITYKLESDSTSDTASDVGNDANLPSIGEVHAEDAQAYCVSLDINCVAGWKWWTATATWTTERELAEDPEDDEVLVSWQSEIYQEAIFQDIDGNGILNSAGDYFIDPVPTRDNVHFIAKIRKNVQSVPSWVLSKQNNVNSGQITIGGLTIAAGLARMSRLVIGERQRRGSIDFYEISFEIHIHESGWRLEPLDAGFREIDYGSRVPVQITDENGDEPTAPVLLDGTGNVLESPTASTAVYGNYQIYLESDLTSLPGIT